MKWSNGLLLTLAIAAALRWQPAWACSSCGSGAADPVILNPLEQRKFYLGMTLAHRFQAVDEQGQTRKDYGPDRKTKLELAYAHRLTSALFVSLDTGLGENRKGSRAKTGMTDTALNLRWTALMQDVTEPWIPQVQLVVSHRFQTTKSLQDSKELYNLDSFGAGYDETFVGADVWFGMQPILFGASFLYSQPWEENTRSGRLQMGPTEKWIGTLGYKPAETFKIIGGVVRDKRGPIELDDQPSPVPSDKLSHDVFLTLETMRVEDDNFRLSWSQKAAFGSNRNATETLTYTLAWMKTL
ncbi:MAG TPA: hypothetical protein VE954_07530 [Oligoflexus sp.]|uniref:hypothetical protein n=1 Tax=Oligoflexus sp. TaxID=1971216 RepID=UPI002D6D8C0F|nr:hypothetical protein [Oligoflexus sp.]HYX32950.1 hypothetical protein [Oligoflexus sp.]